MTLATKQEVTTRPLQLDLSPLPRRLLPPRVRFFIWIASLFSFIFAKLWNSYLLPWKYKDSETVQPQARWSCHSRSTCRRWAPCRARPQPMAWVTRFTPRWQNIDSEMLVRVNFWFRDVYPSNVWHDHPQHGQHPQAAMRKYQCKMCPQVIFLFASLPKYHCKYPLIISPSTSKHFWERTLNWQSLSLNIFLEISVQLKVKWKKYL